MILHAEEIGQGPPVALLHGLFGRGRNLATVARALAASGRRAIMLDLRNHGASPHAPGMAYAALAEDVQDTLRSLDALPAAVIGHSMGGKTAMAMALLWPEIVTRLLVVDIAPVRYSHSNAGVAAALLALPLTPGLTRQPAAAALAGAVPDPAVRAFLLQNLQFGEAPFWRIGLKNIADAIAEIEGWPSDFGPAQFDGPTLFLSGGASDYVGPDGMAAARRLFPNAQFAQLAGAGHWLHAEQPGPFAAAACGFILSGTTPSGTI